MRDMSERGMKKEKWEGRTARRAGDSRCDKGQTVSMIMNEGQEEHLGTIQHVAVYSNGCDKYLSFLIYDWARKKSSSLSCSLLSTWFDHGCLFCRAEHPQHVLRDFSKYLKKFMFCRVLDFTYSILLCVVMPVLCHIFPPNNYKIHSGKKYFLLCNNLLNYITTTILFKIYFWYNQPWFKPVRIVVRHFQ